MDLKVSMLACRSSTIGLKHSLKTGSRWKRIESRRGEAVMMLSTPECIKKEEGGAEAVDRPEGLLYLNTFFSFRTGGDPATDRGEWITPDGGEIPGYRHLSLKGRPKLHEGGGGKVPATMREFILVLKMKVGGLGRGGPGRPTSPCSAESR